VVTSSSRPSSFRPEPLAGAEVFGVVSPASTPIKLWPAELVLVVSEFAEDGLSANCCMLWSILRLTWTV
jgi:hypothetical protein